MTTQPDGGSLESSEQPKRTLTFTDPLKQAVFKELREEFEYNASGMTDVQYRRYQVLITQMVARRAAFWDFYSSSGDNSLSKVHINFHLATNKAAMAAGQTNPFLSYAQGDELNIN